MEWVRFKFGDWFAATRGLNVAEEGVYMRLLAHAYYTERPLSADIPELCKTLGIKWTAHKALVAPILRRFFQESPEGWTHARVAKERAYVEGRLRNLKKSSGSHAINKGDLSNGNNGPNSAMAGEKIREEEDKNKKEAAPDPNGSPMANLFTQYTAWLSAGEEIDLKRARAMLAKWRNEVGDVELAAILLRAQDKGVSGPIAWITAAIKGAAKKKELRIQ